MSYKATTWAFQQRGLKPASWRVLVMLADRHNPDFGCFPRQSTLAADCEMSRSTVNVHLDRLEAAGLIRRVQRVCPDTGRQLSTRYLLAFEEAFAGPAPAGGPVSAEAPGPSPKSGHGKGEGPCPVSAGSRVRNPDTNLVIESTTTAAASRRGRLLDLSLKACGAGVGPSSREALAETGDVIEGWLAAGADFDLDVLPVIRARTKKRDGPEIRSFAYFTGAVEFHRDRRLEREATAGAGAGAGAGAASASAESVDRAAVIAGWLAAGRYVAPSMVSNVLRDEMLERQLVTRDQLRSAQIY